MDSSIASLFDDDDIEEEVPKRHKTPHSEDENAVSTRPTKRRRRTFADSDDEGIIAPREVNTRVFEDEEYGGIEWDGIEAAERKVARNMPPLTPHPILPSSSPPPEDKDQGKKNKRKENEEKKPRKKAMVLNEALLVGPHGFPKLINDVKGFKPKGKGHEASDLINLLQVYQFWIHQLYPKAPFRETVTRVEKLCHTRLLMSAVSRWKDEAKGIVHAQEQENIDPNSDEEADDGEAQRSAREAPSDVDGLWEEPTLSRAPSRPPTSASEREEEDLYDEDIDALIAEDMAQQQAPATAGDMDMDFDDGSLWENFDDPEMSAHAVSKHAAPPKPATNQGMGQDDFDWDALDSMDMGEPLPAQQAQPPPASTAPPSSVDDDMDDFYV